MLAPGMLPLFMVHASKKTNTSPSRTQVAFTASQQRDILVRQEIENNRIATDAKTARLKALRLAKEAEDRAAAAAAPAPVKPSRPRKTKSAR
jgi:hypothetical protein